MDKKDWIYVIIAIVVVSIIASFATYSMINKEERVSLSPPISPYKINATGSCIGKCGSNGGGCYCDSYCWMNAGDCCPNFLQANCLTNAQKITWNSYYPSLAVLLNTTSTNSSSGGGSGGGSTSNSSSSGYYTKAEVDAKVNDISGIVYQRCSMFSTLKEGITTALMINKGKIYTTSLNYIDSGFAKFTVNGNTTDSISVGQTYKLSDSTILKVKAVRYSTKINSTNEVDFTLDAC